MPFTNISFIKTSLPFDKNDATSSPIFRKSFILSDNIKEAKISICCLGMGYCYINGKKISVDLFTAPVSHYEKTLWYNTYDVTSLLKEGENVIAVHLGNGFYNESIETAWHWNNADWRDNPKFILKLEIDGKEYVTSDSSWKCISHSAVTYNQLRHGENFDARLHDENVYDVGFDDSLWENAITDTNPPKGIMRECTCEPIRECGVYTPVDVIKTTDNTFIYDFGQNISGYSRVKLKGESGQKITLYHTEAITADNKPDDRDAATHHYPTCEKIQYDEIICSGKEFTWSPMFTYHGFRYVEVSGIKSADDIEICSIFTHQDIKRRSHFECSDYDLNCLFDMGIMSTYSNTFYSITDCPTREKMGWCNDSQSSMEQFLTDFEMENLLKKWLIDIYDAMKPSGQLPGTIPTPEWGYNWGNGPVSDGILFEIPYRLYIHTGDKKPLIESIPYFEKYLEFIETKYGQEYGLDDWAGPEAREEWVKSYVVNAILQTKFIGVTILAKEFAGQDTSKLREMYELKKKAYIDAYIDEEGRCTIDKQTAVAMTIFFGLYNDLEPLKCQLKALVEKENFHHTCGMVGLRYLYEALDMCGLSEYAFKIITAKGYPSYMDWLESGVTTLYEMWDMNLSQNHHMYSHFMSYLMKTAVGINIVEPGYKKVEIKPVFFEDLAYAKGHIDTVRGRICVDWRKEGNKIYLKTEIPEGVIAIFNENTLPQGTNILTL